MTELKLVQKFGNSAHVILPKQYVGKRIRFLLEPKTFNDIKSEILEILKPYFENILGVYLYGSYARNEQTIESDVDILVIASAKLKIIDKVDDYSIISITLNMLESTLKNDAVLILPIIKEAKAVINPVLLEKYRQNKFTKKNTKLFIDDCKEVLALNKKGIDLGFEVGSLVYSLMLRIRGLLMIKLMLNGRLYSKSLLFNYLKQSGFSNDEVEELYKIYSSERNNVKITKNNIITKTHIADLLAIAQGLLKEIQFLLK